MRLSLLLVVLALVSPVSGISGASADEAAPDYDPEEVLSKIKSTYIKEIFACYHAGLRRNSDLAGRIELSLTLAKNGKVKEVDATGFDSDVDHCIEKAAKEWRFPAAPVEHTVPVPFSLKPSAPVDAPADVVNKVHETLQKHYVEGMKTCLPKVKAKKVKKGKAPPPPPKPKPVQLDFTLRMDGSVRDLTAKGLDKKGNKCLVTQGKDWAFPEAAGDSFYTVAHTVEL